MVALTLKPWAVGPDGLPAQPKSNHQKPPTASSSSEEYERKLERSKRKLERGYAAHQESKKRSKVVEFHVAPIKKKKKNEADEEFLLPTGAHGRQAIIEDGTAPPVPEADQAKPSSSPVKKPEQPQWFLRLKKERDAARIRRFSNDGDVSTSYSL